MDGTHGDEAHGADDDDFDLNDGQSSDDEAPDTRPGEEALSAHEPASASFGCRLCRFAGTAGTAGAAGAAGAGAGAADAVARAAGAAAAVEVEQCR